MQIWKEALAVTVTRHGRCIISTTLPFKELLLCLDQPQNDQFRKETRDEEANYNKHPRPMFQI
jgi:hypothetical protein